MARSPRGFLAAYDAAGGNPEHLSEHWVETRANFLTRHIAQARAHGESWWEDGEPTRRHLALIAWAHSPTPARLLRWMETPRRNPGNESEYRGVVIHHGPGGYTVDGQSYPAMRYAMAHVDRALAG